MAYSELVKNFNRIREYMREFYIYGFKNREEYDRRSARSYDDERRRIESWLGDYMQFRQTPDGKNVFLSIDSRAVKQNPLYKGWKAKSFTDGDISLHFILFDILFSPSVSLSLNEITRKIDAYLSEFEELRLFDESTVRKKLKEYVSEGLIIAEKKGKSLYYRRAEMTPVPDSDCLSFFSEMAPCGVIGSYLLDKSDGKNEIFAFKHHYITEALDSEVLYQLFQAMRKKCYIRLRMTNRKKDKLSEKQVVPLRIMLGVQSGRQYLMAYRTETKSITSFRIDYIVSVVHENQCQDFENLRKRLAEIQRNMWGVGTKGNSNRRMEHIEFTIRYFDDEKYIYQRLKREKRCGKVERIDKNTARFSADVYNAEELIPWIRTFICRIIDLKCSNEKMESLFKQDIKEMYSLYGLEDFS